MTTYEKIIYFCNEKCITKTQLERDCGFSQNSVNKWKNSMPTQSRLAKIASYFDIPVSALMPDPDNAPGGFQIERTIVFPVIGTIAAGYDSVASEIPNGQHIEIPASMLRGRSKDEYFVLQVKGDSMYPKFLEGDNLLCLRTDSVDPGSIAVVLYDGEEATVKKVNYVQGEDWLELVPNNPEYVTKRISGEALNQCRILGKVIKLIRDI